MRFYGVLVFLPLCGCQMPYVVVEAGVGAQAGLSKYVNPPGRDIAPFILGARIGGNFLTSKDGLALDVQAGPNFVDPTAEETANGYSLDLEARLRVTDSPTLQPYALVGAGLFVLDDRWQRQATGWGFTLGAGFGAMAKLLDRTWLVVEYRYWHESNGSKLFGSPRPNDGYDSDMLFIGVQWDL